jgi:malonyl-CoA O-methyltransferase
MLNSKHIRQRFDRAAKSFDSADFVHTATRDGLLSRIQPLLVDAKIVVDLGAATGAANRDLEKRFKPARVVAIDIAHNMLQRARTKKSWLSKTAFAQARAEALPLANESVDVVFANLLLPWLDDPTPVFSEVARVLRKGGVFAFATLGPDSLQEIRRAWAQVDERYVHVNRFADMHDLGDGLVNAGLRDPVLDVDRLSINYESPDRLFEDLSAVGARNTLRGRAPMLTGKERFGAMVATMGNAAEGGKIELDLELVYGHCWGAGPKLDPSNYRIDAAEIPIRRR